MALAEYYWLPLGTAVTDSGPAPVADAAAYAGGLPAGGRDVGAEEEEDSEVERLLQQVADARHAGDRRDAMSQLSSLLQDNPRVRPVWHSHLLQPQCCRAEEASITRCCVCCFLYCRSSMRSVPWACQCCCPCWQRTGMTWSCLKELWRCCSSVLRCQTAQQQQPSRCHPRWVALHTLARVEYTRGRNASTQLLSMCKPGRRTPCSCAWTDPLPHPWTCSGSPHHPHTGTTTTSTDQCRPHLPGTRQRPAAAGAAEA